MNQVILSACVDVLVVEDDPNWVFFYRKIFERLGIACEVAMTIEDAEQKLDTGLFRYILCDGTGWDSVIRRSLDLGCTVVIQSGDPESFDIYGVVTIGKIQGANAVVEAFLTVTGLRQTA